MIDNKYDTFVSTLGRTKEGVEKKVRGEEVGVCKHTYFSYTINRSEGS